MISSKSYMPNKIGLSLDNAIFGKKEVEERIAEESNRKRNF